MHVLLVSATASEISPFLTLVQSEWAEIAPMTFVRENVKLKVLISGVGMHRMSFELGRELLRATPDLCINAGIAGAFENKLSIGDVVQVSSETMIDLGAENADGRFLTLEEIGLPEDISVSASLVNPHPEFFIDLPTARSVCANTSHGEGSRIREMIRRWDPDIESMEGGAFFYCCLKTSVPFLEIRAISNIVEPRNTANWNIPLAVNNLSSALTAFLNSLD